MSTKLKEGTKPASETVKVTAKKHRWYLGGIASAMAAACTHPLDLLKVGSQCKASRCLTYSPFPRFLATAQDKLN